jgi:hypothetical protein
MSGLSTALSWNHHIVKRLSDHETMHTIVPGRKDHGSAWILGHFFNDRLDHTNQTPLTNRTLIFVSLFRFQN